MKNIARQAVVLFVLVLLCAAGTAHPAGVDMKEGEWEISSETSMAMEGMSMPPMANKSTYCLTRKDPVPKSERDKECRIVDQRVTGNKVSWRMECKNGEGEGEISYRGTTYGGYFRMKMVEEGQAMTMNTKLAGRYFGPCPNGRNSGPTGETAKPAVDRGDPDRDDSAKNKGGDSSSGENGILKSPVKGIRNLFGF
jgi:hypothetical protein